MGVANDPATGRDRHLWVNHLGPFLLTRLLLPAMGQGSRVVNVSSRASLFGRLNIAGGAIADDQHHWCGPAASGMTAGVRWSWQRA
jgi:NAD(P)-dependent dehydrogenase (short-subunit alcohol dehydrogenase family)